MTAHPSYIIRRGTTLVFRRRVPAVAKNFYSKSFFSFSLRTHFISEARRRAAVAARFTDDLIGLIEMCGADMLDERQLDCMVDDLMRFEVAATEALRETCGPRGPEAVTAAVRLHEATRETMRAALVYNDYEAVSAPLGRTINRLGLPVEPGSADWLRAARRAARALIEVADENINREQGIYRADSRLASTIGCAPRQAGYVLPPIVQHGLPPAPPASSFAAQASRSPGEATAQPDRGLSPNEPFHEDLAAPTEQEAAAKVQAALAPERPPTRRHAPDRAPVPSHAAPGAQAEPSAASDTPLSAQKRFSDWFNDAIDLKREEKPGWDTNNLANWNSTKKLFLEAHGDRPMSYYTKGRLLEFRAFLRALPKNHHKSSDSRGLHTIIEEAEAEEARNMIIAENEIAEHGLNRGDAEQRRSRARVQRVRVSTVYRHMQALQFIFRLAADHGAAPANAMKGVIWNTTQVEKLQSEEKDMKRLPWGDKLADLLSTSAFTAPVPPGAQLHDVFWPTLIAVHSGMREEEALQLKTDDFDTMKGIPIFRVQCGEGQHIKSGTRHRIVPIHKNLIELGLLKHVENCRRKGQEWLFPDIERCAAKGRLSGTFTKTFGHYRIKEGVYDPRRDFHSLRTHFNVELKRAKCPLEIRKRLLGHKLRDITEEHYDPEGSPIEEFREWADGIEIDISRVRSPHRDLADLHPDGTVVAFAARG
ncbi:tyrosine-type recombinase/integrase [Allgaiera indica]|nr:tyrosine-type recombinase/integrase [Allgaiera indica]SDX94446.1 Phage integrase family protein [Allgaiera indica]